MPPKRQRVPEVAPSPDGDPVLREEEDPMEVLREMLARLSREQREELLPLEEKKSVADAPKTQSLSKIPVCDGTSREEVHHFVKEIWPKQLRILGWTDPSVMIGNGRDIGGVTESQLLADSLFVSLPRDAQRAITERRAGSSVADSLVAVEEWITACGSVAVQLESAKSKMTTSATWIQKKSLVESLEATTRKHFRPYLDKVSMLGGTADHQLMKMALGGILPREVEFLQQMMLERQVDQSVLFGPFADHLREVLGARDHYLSGRKKHQDKTLHQKAGGKPQKKASGLSHSLS